MKHLKKLTLTLALLITAVGGAWADIAVGNVFKTGSTIDFGTSSVRYKQFSGSSDNSSMGISGMVTLTYEEYSNGMHKFRFPTGSGAQFMYIVSDNNAEPWGIRVSGGEGTMGNPYSFEVLFKEQVSLSINNNKDEATFNMPAFDATVNYMLVRDMQDQANPVTFSGLPTTGDIIVKKGDDGKYQPAEALTIQLIDPLAAAEAQNIIAADGITVTVEKKGDGDTWTSGTFADFMADMQLGTYRLTATPKDETSPYDGTVTSGEFTLVEKYDLVVKPADEYSKGKLDNVTVGTEEITPDATTGKVTKTGIDPDTEVKLKAKRGYVIEKVEAKKTVIPMLNAATAENIGMVVCNKGHLHDAKEAVPAGCTAVGILGKVTGTGHGLILALSDATSQTWNTINGWTSVTTYASTTLKQLPDDTARGSNLTSYSTLGSTTVSNWCVAQKSDYEAIFTNLGSTTGDSDGTTYDGNVNAYITTGVGGTAITDVYWSATFRQGNICWSFDYISWGNYNKTDNLRVWPVLGF